MPYWCEDRARDFEQRRLDAAQEDALAAALARGAPWAQRIAAETRPAKDD